MDGPPFFAILGGVMIVVALFIGLPWLLLHYITKWKQAPRITREDEQLLDEMHLLARRLEERLHTIERIVAAENPEYRPGLGLDDREITSSRPVLAKQSDGRK